MNTTYLFGHVIYSYLNKKLFLLNSFMSDEFQYEHSYTEVTVSFTHYKSEM